MAEPDTVTRHVTINTGLLAHRLVTRIAFFGKTLGLDITHEHDGGKLTRSHLLTVTGRRDVVNRFWAYMARVAEILRSEA